MKNGKFTNINVAEIDRYVAIGADWYVWDVILSWRRWE